MMMARSIFLIMVKGSGSRGSALNRALVLGRWGRVLVMETLFDGPQPVATVYLTTEAEIDNAAQRSEQHWKTLRREMATADVPEAVLELIDPLVPDAHLSGQTLAVVASSAGVRTVDHFPEPPVRDAFRWGPLPWVGPIVEQRQSGIAHVTVAIDRTGADIVLFR